MLYRILETLSSLRGDASPPLLHAVLEHVREGDDIFLKTFPPRAPDERIASIISRILPYTARYWIKTFEKAIEALFCANFLRDFLPEKEVLYILDVGSGSGQMVDAIVTASGRRCIVDGLDNMQEKDTHQEIFLQYPFTREMYNADFNIPDRWGNLGRPYDVIFGLNSIRVAGDLGLILKAFKNYLGQQGVILFNVITPNFQQHFFTSTYEFAQRFSHARASYYASGANYIPQAYTQASIEAICQQNGLSLISFLTYLFLEPFSPYRYFTPAYQFTYDIASLRRILDTPSAEKYTTAYAYHIYSLSVSLPAYLDFQLTEALSSRSDGCHAMIWVS